jgi:hydroxyethylthiazole kinase-like uncharacterized protein yjeF
MPEPEVNGPSLWAAALPRLDPSAHKYQRGHCLVVSGPPLRTGASRLAAIAALNAGAGAVSIAGERDALMVQAAHVTAIMLKETAAPDDLAALAASGFQSAVMGPASGTDEDARGRLAALLASALPLVLDADALTMRAGRAHEFASRPSGAPLVLTPHDGEFRRLFGDLDRAEGDRPGDTVAFKVDSALAAARLSRAVIVRKGRETVIAAPDGRAAVNRNAGPELATAGSGDVLAGIIGSHLAQGMPAYEAACAGVWLHSACGALFGVGLTADRLVELVRPVDAFLKPA